MSRIVYKLSLIAVITLMFTGFLFSQTDSSKIFKRFSSNEAAELANDPNYIFFSQGLGLQRNNYTNRMSEPLIFEAQIAPNFKIRIDSLWGISFSPKIIIRMFNRESEPVNSPCYIPNLTVFKITSVPFMYNSNLFNWWIRKNDITFLTFKVAHYSNGQEGDFYMPDGKTINVNYGNFATNFFEIGFNWARKDSTKKIDRLDDIIYGKVAFEQHVNFWREENLHELYYFTKIYVETQRNFAERLKLTFIPSVMFGVGKFATKYSAETSMSWRFWNKSDFSLYGRLYWGPDYYNLRYENTILNFSVGFLADPIAFPLF